MKNEPKSFASLSSGLLARKGAARPAMRPQGFSQVGAGLEDLGWNDMGFEPPKPADTLVVDAEHDGFGEVIPAHPHKLAGLTPVESPVHNQQAEIAGRLSARSSDNFDEDEIDDTAELYEPEQDEAESVADLHEPEQDEAESVAEAEPVPAQPVAKTERVPVRAVPVVATPRVPKSRAAPDRKPKAAFTLRLDSERHLKLRLACAVDGRSAQQIVTQALDRLLEGMPELDAMAQKAKRKG